MRVKKGALLSISALFLSLSFFGQQGFAEEQVLKVENVEQIIEEGAGITQENGPLIPQTNEAVNKAKNLLPEKFDFNSGNVQTIMRDQGRVGICWAYSALDVITSSNKKEFGVEYTLSPNYYNYYSGRQSFSDAVNPYGDRALNDGGTHASLFFQSALNNNGTLEEDFPTPLDPALNTPMPLADFEKIKEKKSPIYVEGIEKIPAISYNSSEASRKAKIEEMKNKIYEYGAVAFSYYEESTHNSKYYDNQLKSSFVPVSDVGTALVPKQGTDLARVNHGVTIVGWDNTYSKDNFTITPTNDGAFLVKNSWGEEPIGAGYFYISYEDIYVLCSEIYAADTKMEQFDNVRTYVNKERSNYYNFSSNTNSVYLASTYSTQEKTELLKAVSFYSEQKGIDYEVYYLNKGIRSWETINNHANMTKIATGTVTSAGMKEIPTESVEIEKQSDYSIIIKVNYPKDISSFHTVFQAVKSAENGSFPDLPAGRTFVSYENAENRIFWRGISDGDLFGGSFKGNLYVNAYTDNLEPLSAIHLSPESKDIPIGGKEQLTAILTPENATNKKITWTSSNPEFVTVDDKGNIYGIKTGTATITATAEDGNKTATSIITVTENDDHGDDHTSATEIELNEMVNFTTHRSGDWDYFSFTPEESGLYVTRVERTKGDNNTFFSLVLSGSTDAYAVTEDKSLYNHVSSLIAGRTYSVALHKNNSLNDPLPAGSEGTLKVMKLSRSIELKSAVTSYELMALGTTKSLDVQVDCPPEIEVYKLKYATEWNKNNISIDQTGLITAENQGVSQYYVSTTFVQGTFNVLNQRIEVSDDHSNDFRFATKLNLNEAVDFTTEYSGDLDYFSFTPEESGLYVTRVERTKGDNNTFFSLVLSGSTDAYAVTEDKSLYNHVSSLIAGRTYSVALHKNNSLNDPLPAGSEGTLKVMKLSRSIELKSAVTSYELMALGTTKSLNVQVDCPPEIEVYKLKYATEWNKNNISIDQTGLITAENQGVSQYYVSTTFVQGTFNVLNQRIEVSDDYSNDFRFATKLNLNEAVDSTTEYSGGLD
ncbi:Ig-like domain-containing protein [Candidatus Enterococcus clewellii]|uniref:BIG2 domain-containing protein n=2 Tax=Candidatus Enterococcus clewellii TaxID=1834193 RepID=A0AAQ3Y1N2_9ENTE